MVTSVPDLNYEDSSVRPGNPWESGAEKPVAERYRVGVQVGILTEDGQAQGSVRDISISGACIDGRDGELPPTGTVLRLGFSFFAHALPVPIHGRVVRHTDTGGFAVRFEDVDFRTQILLRALLSHVVAGESATTERPHSDRVRISAAGRIDAELPPALFEACSKLAEAQEIPLDEWIAEQLERAVLDAS